jgi:hypothetical protein
LSVLLGVVLVVPRSAGFVNQNVNQLIKEVQTMYIVIKDHCQIPYEDAGWPKDGWSETAGRDGKCWTFDSEADAQELADYMNSPHHDYAAWRYGYEWGWVVMPLKQFQELVPGAEEFVSVPDIKSQLAEDIQKAKQTSMDTLRQRYYEFCDSVSPEIGAVTRMFGDDAGAYGDGGQQNSLNFGPITITP